MGREVRDWFNPSLAAAAPMWCRWLIRSRRSSPQTTSAICSPTPSHGARMPKYDIIDPVEHDGDRHESGTIELTAEQAAPLLAVGSVSASKAARGAGHRPPTPRTKRKMARSDAAFASLHTRLFAPVR